MGNKFLGSIIGTITIMIANPAYGQISDSGFDVQEDVAATISSQCTVAFWTPTNFKYSLQGAGALWGGVIGALIDQAANKGVREERKNELEKALDPDVAFEIFKSSNIRSISEFNDIKFITLPKDLDEKSSLKSNLRSAHDDSECYIELFVTKVRADKTMIYGTFFDTSFALKDFRSKGNPRIYKDTIRRKVQNFPPKSEEEIDSSYQGVRQVFLEQINFFINKYKSKSN